MTTWQWGEKYPPVYVERLAAGVGRHLGKDHRFLVCRPAQEDMHLTRIPGCFARLRAFDPSWQRALGIREGDRIVCLDLDLIVTGPLGGLFDRPEPFVIMQGANSANPCPYNGSMWMLTAGYRPDVWHDFSPAKLDVIPRFEFPDDQGWFWHKFSRAAGWRCGRQTGVYAFQQRGWPGGELLPRGARVVAFPGRRDPSQYTHLSWVREYWCR